MNDRLLPQEEEEAGDLLHCLREFDDRVDDGKIMEEGGEGEDTLESSSSNRQLMVTRPRASLPSLFVALVEGMTGAVSWLKLNWNRDASPIEMTLLRAR